MIRRHVDEQMPFMATERWLMLGVKAGGDRQALHEVIRVNSLATAEAVGRGGPNNLLDRLSADASFARVPSQSLKAELDPSRYTGRAAEQVREFLAEYLPPLMERARGIAVTPDAAEVRV
jgi:adenylosuccinate lyase